MLQFKSGTFFRTCQRASIAFALFSAILAAGFKSFALNESPQTFTLDGQLFVTGTSTPLLDSNAVLKIQIINPTGTCLLYEELQTVNTSATDGYFHINVGSLVGSAKRTTSDPGRSMNQIFQNLSVIPAANVPGQTCAGGAYTPAAGAVRYFRMTVTPSATNVADTLTPDIVIDAVPQAMIAQSVQGLERAGILQVATGTSLALTQANLEAVFTTPAYTNLQTILAGNFMRQDSSGASLPSYAADPSGVSAGDIWYDSTTNQVKYQSNSGVQTLGTSSGGIGSLTVSSDFSVNGVTAGTVSSGSVLLALNSISTPGKVSGSALTSGTISGSTSINTSGSLISTGTVSGLTVQATNLRVYNAANYAQFQAAAGMSTDVTYTLPTTAGSNGQFLTTNGTGTLSWASPTVAGTISIGQGGTNAVSFAGNRIIASNSTGTALQAFACSLNQVISFDASGNAACSAVTSLGGFILNGGNTTAGAISIGTNDNQPLQLKTNNTVAMTISQGGNIGIGTATPAAPLDVSGTIQASGSALISDNAAWANTFLSGSAPGGSVLIAGKTATGKAHFGMYESGSGGYNGMVSTSSYGSFYGFTYNTSTPISGSGLYVHDDHTEVYASGQKAFRADGADVSFYTPNAGNVATERITILGTSGFVGIGTNAPATALNISGAFTANGMSSAPGVSASRTGRIYYDYSANKFKVSQNGGAYTDLVPTGNGDVLNNGNTLGAPLTVGTNDAQPMKLEVNNSTAMTISQNGYVGIGNTSPASPLDIASTSTDTSGTFTGQKVLVTHAPAADASMAIVVGSSSSVQHSTSQNALVLTGTAASVSYSGTSIAANATNVTGLSATANASGGGSANTLTAISATSTYSASGIGNAYGVKSQTNMNNNGTLANFVGGSFGITQNHASATTTAAYGVKSNITHTAGTISAAYGVHSAVTKTGGTTNNGYGVYISSVQATNKWSLYSDDATAPSFFAGSIGIGITAPATALDISGALTVQGMSSAPAVSASNTGRIYFDYTLNKFKVSQNGAAYVDLVGAGGGGSGDVLNNGNTLAAPLTVGTNDAQPLKLEVNNSTAMTISQDGNVGIGTTSPLEKLSVAGNLIVGTQATRTVATTNRGQLALGSTYIQTVNANTNVDWNDGNLQEINTFVCDGSKTVTFLNVKDGAAYSLLLSGDANHSGTCLFSAGGGRVFKTSGGAVAPTAGKDVLFTFAVIGNTIIYNMTDNLQ